ncbi:MAG: 4Fe-4S dicluster domain-containing protein, partial [Anaerolineales bacterium]|nr:4Fe-4S dicluster domain-containing protein [Anaerolineales bacterium]
MTSGITFNIQQFSTEDGPGIRTTVFMKGCPLHCVWCHNPEGMRPSQDLMWYDVRCIAARDCLRVCPEEALDLTQDGMLIDRQRCTLCGECAEACPS